MAVATGEIPWSRFVALGDSVTEGVGDPADGALRGWAGRLADGLRLLNPELEYRNLARRGLTTRQIRESQVEPALELNPDLISVVAGMNDILASQFDAETYHSELDAIVKSLATTGATLLMGTLPKHLPIMRFMPRRVAAERRTRLQVASDIVLEVAAEYGADCMDAPPEWRYTMAECSIDGCHPNARGHAHIARLGLEALYARAGIPAPAGGNGHGGWISASLAQLRWLASEGYLSQRPGSSSRPRSESG